MIDRAEQKQRDVQRAQERSAKQERYARAFDVSEIDSDIFSHDDSFVHDLRESLTRYAIAH